MEVVFQPISLDEALAQLRLPSVPLPPTGTTVFVSEDHPETEAQMLLQPDRYQNFEQTNNFYFLFPDGWMRETLLSQEFVLVGETMGAQLLRCFPDQERLCRGYSMKYLSQTSEQFLAEIDAAISTCQISPERAKMLSSRELVIDGKGEETQLARSQVLQVFRELLQQGYCPKELRH